MYGDNGRKPVIGIDYDNTFDKHPKMFMRMVKANKDSIEFYIVTYRAKQPLEPLMQEFVNITGNDVIFTNGKAKRDNLSIDIWIDDRPISITHDYTDTGFVPSDLTKSLYLKRHTCILHNGITGCHNEMEVGTGFKYCPHCGGKLIGG